MGNTDDAVVTRVAHVSRNPDTKGAAEDWVRGLAVVRKFRRAVEAGGAPLEAIGRSAALRESVEDAFALLETFVGGELAEDVRFVGSTVLAPVGARPSERARGRGTR